MKNAGSQIVFTNRQIYPSEWFVQNFRQLRKPNFMVLCYINTLIHLNMLVCWSYEYMFKFKLTSHLFSADTPLQPSDPWLSVVERFRTSRIQSLVMSRAILMLKLYITALLMLSIYHISISVTFYFAIFSCYRLTNYH